MRRPGLGRREQGRGHLLDLGVQACEFALKGLPHGGPAASRWAPCAWPQGPTAGAASSSLHPAHQLADPCPPGPADVPASSLGLTQRLAACASPSGLPGGGHLTLGWAGWFRTCWVLRASGCVCMCACTQLGLLVSVCVGDGGLV